MSNFYDRNRYANPSPERARNAAYDRARDEDPNEERNMWQGGSEDGGWGRERDARGDESARHEGGAIRFERGNERRFSDAAYGLRVGQARDRGEREWGETPRAVEANRPDYERGGFERSDYNRNDLDGRRANAAPRGYDRSQEYSRGFGPNHGFGYPSQRGRDSGRQEHRPGLGFGPGGYGGSFGSSSYNPTGLDRDRLAARGEQGYGRELGGHAGRGPKGYKRTDERIHEDVCDQLSRDDEVDASEIAVRVENGEVTLEGSIETRRQKHRAEELAAEVMGVEDVHNRVRVRKSMLSELKDKVTGDEPPLGGHAGSGTKTTGMESGRRNELDRH